MATDVATSGVVSTYQGDDCRRLVHGLAFALAADLTADQLSADLSRNLRGQVSVADAKLLADLADWHAASAIVALDRFPGGGGVRAPSWYLVGGVGWPAPPTSVAGR